MSTNSLLSGSNIKPEAVPIATHKVRTNKLTPCWRYHKELGSRLLKYDDELERLGDGWVDHPGKLNRLPGHEKLYDSYINPIKPQHGFSESVFLVKTAEEIEQCTKDAEDATALKLKTEAAECDKAARLNPIVHACPDCDAKFSDIRRLNMHRLGKHKNNKKIALMDEKDKIADQAGLTETKEI